MDPTQSCSNMSFECRKQLVIVRVNFFPEFIQFQVAIPFIDWYIIIFAPIIGNTRASTPIKPALPLAVVGNRPAILKLLASGWKQMLE